MDALANFSNTMAIGSALNIQIEAADALIKELEDIIIAG
jgi:hypothetical protein